MGGEGQRGCRPLIAVAAAVALASLWLPALQGFETNLSDRQIERALRLARGPAAERARFHDRYIFPTDRRAPVIDNLQLDSIEVISEFRRTELLGEDHARINDLFGRAGLGEVRKALAPWRGRVAIVAHVRVLIAGTLLSTPPVDVALDGIPRAGRPVRRDISGEAGLVGGTIETPFSAAAVGETGRTAAVRWTDTLLGTVNIDFRELD